MGTGIRSVVKDAFDYLRKFFSGKNEDLAFYLIIIISFLVFVVGTNLFVELSEDVSVDAVDQYDEKVTDYITSFRTPELNSIFIFITDMGGVYSYLVASILVGIFFFVKLRNYKFILQLLGVVIISGLANIALKRFFDRARPSEEHLVVIKSLSYPSGHAMSAMAFYGFLIYLIFQIKMSRWARILLTILFTFMILAIGISRIYLGVHYPSDVAGGFIAGLIWVALCVVLFNVIDLLRKRKGRRAEGEREENLETEEGED